MNFWLYDFLKLFIELLFDRIRLYNSFFLGISKVFFGFNFFGLVINFVYCVREI